MLNGERPQPLAKGTLDQRPLAHLLIYAKERKLVGTVTLGDGAAELVFSDGMLTKVATPSSKPTGAAQTASTVRSLFALPSTTPFAYFDKFDALPDAASTSLDPLSFVWHPIRDALGSKQVDAIVDRAAQTPLRIPGNVDTEVFGFDGEETRVVAQMRDRATPLADLERISTRAKRVVYVLLVTKKVEAGVAQPATPPANRLQLDSISDAMKSPSPPPSTTQSRAPSRISTVPSPEQTLATRLRASTAPGSVPGRKITPDPSGSGDATRARIRDRAANIDKEDYFQTLGIPADAPTDVIRATFFTLAKQWHPDRLPAALSDVREACTRVFTRMNEAYQTLSDPEKRARYVDRLSSGSTRNTEEQDTIVKVVEAAQLFQKAEIMFKRNDAIAAEQLVRRANELDPKQPEYMALLAWIEATKPGNASEMATLGYIEQLSKAIELNENSERAHFYRAMLYKRLGHSREAMRDFRTVVERNPRNVDAQRELRLFNMRGGTSTQPRKEPPRQGPTTQHPGGNRPEKKEEAKGLFASFFNNKKK